MFSISLVKRGNKIKLYKFTKEQLNSNYKEFIKTDNILCQTFLEDEITLYKFSGDDDQIFDSICTIRDPREYNVINIHEDLPGIDHIGIVHKISGYFVENEIPLLYINTFSYNLILISDEHLEKALNVLEKISIVSY